MNHDFIKKEIAPGADFVVESCLCGARLRRYRSTRVLWEQPDGTFSAHKTGCFGHYANPIEAPPAVRQMTGTPPIIEAIAIIRLLMEDRARGEACARNFLQSYAV